MVAADPTPRVVILYRRNEYGTNEFDVQFLGERPMNIVSLIGALSRIAAKLACDQPRNEIPSDGSVALIIRWVEERKETEWFLHKDVPVEPLIGIIEIVKQDMVAANAIMRQQSQQRGGIVGPDGRPVGRPRVIT